MTELQMGLIGLGAFAVIGVLAYNKWQELRQRKQADQLVKTSHPDVLLGEAAKRQNAGTTDKIREDVPAPVEKPREPREAAPSGERREPVLILDADPGGEEDTSAMEPGLAAGPSERGSSLAPSFREPVLDPAQYAAADADLPDYSHLLSPQIDFIAAVDMVDPVAASEICTAQRDALSHARKPVRWIGYNEQAAKWEVISSRDKGDGSEYRHIRAGLQLADRQGPASDNDLAVFSTAMQDLADQFSGIADLPSRQAAFETASRLDEFCASVDIQIGINIVSRGQAFPGTKLRTLAEVAGMAIDEDKRCTRRDEDGNVLFVLLNQDPAGFTLETMKTLNTHGLTFLLDVPCVAQGERVFNQMVDLARHFAEVLQGELVDDNQRPLTEGSMEPIRRQIAHYQTLLAERQLPAGGVMTRRLFS